MSSSRLWMVQGSHYWHTSATLHLTLGKVPLECQTGVVVPVFKKGYQRLSSSYRGITILSLPGMVYIRVLERTVHLLVECHIQEEPCSFPPGRRTLDQLYNLTRVLRGHRNLANQLCVLWTWKVLMTVSLEVSCWRCTFMSA